jgi:hypothetical protein
MPFLAPSIPIQRRASHPGAGGNTGAWAVALLTIWICRRLRPIAWYRPHKASVCACGLGNKILDGQDSKITSAIPLFAKSLRDWVAKMTATFDLRSTFSHSRILALKCWVAQHDPGFVQHQQGGLTLKALLKPVKQVCEDWQNDSFRRGPSGVQARRPGRCQLANHRSRHPAAAQLNLAVSSIPVLRANGCPAGSAEVRHGALRHSPLKPPTGSLHERVLCATRVTCPHLATGPGFPATLLPNCAQLHRQCDPVGKM